MSRSPSPLLRASLALSGVMAIGTLGFCLLEGWGIGRSLYFTVITISTVGYGDEGISQAGRVFAAGLIMAGIGVASYSLGMMIRAVLEGTPRWRKRMQARINALADHTIVCGYGRMGEAVCWDLSAEAHPLVVIESNPAAFAKACEEGLLAVEGSGTDDETLIQAGIERAKNLVSAVDSELENLAVTLTASELRPDLMIIARAEREHETRKLRRAGATRIVSPFRSGGTIVAEAILGPEGMHTQPHAARIHSDLTLAEITIEEGSALVGTRLAEYGRGEGNRIAFVALQRPRKQLIVPPRGLEEMLPQDLLIVAGAERELRKMRALAKANSHVVDENP